MHPMGNDGASMQAWNDSESNSDALSVGSQPPESHVLKASLGPFTLGSLTPQNA